VQCTDPPRSGPRISLVGGSLEFGPPSLERMSYPGCMLLGIVTMRFDDAMQPAHVRFLFNLPVAIEVDQARDFAMTPSNRITSIPVASGPSAAIACLGACANHTGCAAWSVAAVAAGGQNCTLYNTAGLNEWRANVTSGVLGTWTQTTSQDNEQCFTMNRHGVGPMFGNISLCAAVDPASTAVSFIAGDTLDDIWDQFESGTPSTTLDGSHGYGAIVLSTAPGGVAQGASTALTFSLSWYYPQRDCTCSHPRTRPSPPATARAPPFAHPRVRALALSFCPHLATYRHGRERWQLLRYAVEFISRRWA
jgi:hypothetical protein